MDIAFAVSDTDHVAVLTGADFHEVVDITGWRIDLAEVGLLLELALIAGNSFAFAFELIGDIDNKSVFDIHE